MDLFEEISSSQIAQALSVIEEYGLVLDEHATFIGAKLIEKHPAEMESFLRSHGYNGGHLESAGAYFPDYGAVYALYDCDRHSRETALSFIDRHYKRNKERS